MHSSRLLPFVLLALPLATAGARVTPQHAVVPDTVLESIVGGAAADINIAFPVNHATSGQGSSGTSWNRSANICQYSCTTGAVGHSQGVGFNVGYSVVVPTGSAVPVLSIYSDGKKRAQTNATFNSTQGLFDLYLGGLLTKCDGGDRNGQFCLNDGTCRQKCQGFCSVTTSQICNRAGDPACPTGETCIETGTNCASLASVGNCVTFDQTGAHNTSGVADGPCSPNPFDSPGEQTCFLLQECSKNPISFPSSGNSNCPTVSGELRVNCATNGAPESVSNFKTGTLNNNGPLHSILADATSPFGPLADQNVYKIVDAGQSTAPTNCVGPNEDD